MNEPIDWRSELEAIAPVTDEERLEDRMQRTRERIAGELRAGQLVFPGWPSPPIGAIEDPRDDAHDAMLYGLWRLKASPLRISLRAAPPAPPRLPWWRRWLLRLLGGIAIVVALAILERTDVSQVAAEAPGDPVYGSVEALEAALDRYIDGRVDEQTLDPADYDRMVADHNARVGLFESAKRIPHDSLAVMFCPKEGRPLIVYARGRSPWPTLTRSHEKAHAADCLDNRLLDGSIAPVGAMQRPEDPAHGAVHWMLQHPDTGEMHLRILDSERR